MDFSAFVIPILEEEDQKFQFLPPNKNAINLDCAKIAKICLKDFFPKANIIVWLVDGKFIRDNVNIEYEEGGHSLRYPFIPDNEVWIDHCVPVTDIYNYLLHELKERSLMLTGIGYDAAHAHASKLEGYARAHPDEIDDLLAKVIIANIEAAKKGV